MKKWIKILLWVVGVVLAILLVVSLLAGPIAKGYINAHGEQLTGRKVEVEHVGVNLFSGNVNVRGLSVYEDDGERQFAGFDTLDVRLHLLRIPFKTLHFSHITLAGFKAAVQQDGDSFNFSSLVDHFATDSTEEKDTTPSGWVMKFYNIRLSHGSLSYDDLRNRKSLSLPDINLRVPGFVLGGEENSEGGLSIGFDRGGRLNVDALYDTREGTYRLDVGLDDFAVENLDAYMADLLDYDQIGGAVSATLTVGGSTQELLKSSVKGGVEVRGGALEAGGEVVAAFDTLRVKIADIGIADKRFDLSEVRLSGLQARYEQWDGYSNIDRMLRKAERNAVTMQTGVSEAKADTSAAMGETAPSKPLQLHVGALRVAGGAVTYVDHSLPDEFLFPVTAIDIRADNLTTAGGNNAAVRAVLPGGGRLAVRWNGDLADWKRSQDLFFTIKGLDMKLLSPWAVAYTGQPVEDGVFGLTTRLNIRNSELDNQNKIDIYKAKVGSRRKDVEPEMKIPLKAALYVLKDKDDKILIDLPVKGNVDSPEFSYMKLVWKTLGNLLVKVATSPARAIGVALGLNGDEMDFIAVNPQQHGLTSEQYHVLSGLAAVAAADSLVSLSLELQVPADDTLSRRHELLNRQVSDYLKEQGLDESRFRVSAAAVETGKPMGYVVSSELKIEE